MFDDKPTPAPQLSRGAPENLPTAEPEDIFAVAEPAPQGGASGVSALDAGVLKPPPASPPPPPPPPPPRPAAPIPKIMPGVSSYPLREPRLSRYLLFIGVFILVVALVGGGGWFLYSSFMQEPREPAQNAQESEAPADAREPAAGPDVGEEITDDRILFGEPIDLDGDGLEGTREADLGTDPNNWDTDQDGLSDYEEVAVWKSDPLNQDSDADGFIDGSEVKNGYSPTGQGKIFEPPVPPQQE